jgi:hypothetical protein
MATYPAFIPDVKPEHARKLFEAPSLRDVFINGLVFVQNKRPAADRLITQATEALCDYASFRHVSAKKSELERPILNPAKRASRARRRPILCVDVRDQGVAMADVINRFSDVRPTRGLWVRGYVQDLHPSTLRQFDAMFLFDMAESDLRRLASVVAIPAWISNRLQECVTAKGGAESEAVLYLLQPDFPGLLPRIEPNPGVIAISSAYLLPEPRPPQGRAFVAEG